MKLIRTPHFKSYVEKVFVGAYKCCGKTEQQARASFEKNFYDEFPMLSFILDNIYPNTIRVGEEYKFITNNIEHTMVPTLGKGPNHDYWGHEIKIPKADIGRMILELVDYKEKVTFENKGFKHGHISHDGHITCYNAYNYFYRNVPVIGFSGALMEVYNFARVSRYGTKVPQGFMSAAH